MQSNDAANGNRHLRFQLCVAVLATAIGLLCARSASASPAAGSHAELKGVVLIVIDTLRVDHLGAYGSERGLTPRMDNMAASGLLFENATAASSWTRASMATIHLGVSPDTHGVIDREHSLPPALPTLAETLSAAGVATVGLHSNANVDATYGFGRGFDYYKLASETEQYPGDDQRMVSAATLTREVLEQIDARELGKPQRFFVSAHYTDPHDPYFDHPELKRGAPPAGRFGGSRSDLRKLDGLSAKLRTRVDEDRIRFLYEGEVAWADRHVGALLDGLDDRGLLEDCLIVITADHGEGLWQHGERGHGRDLYEEQIHVPLILRVPEPWARDPTRVAARVAHEDIPSTIVAALGTAPPPSWTGRDLLAIASHDAPGRSLVYSALSLDWIDLGALIEGDRKAIRNRSFDPLRKGRIHVVRDGDTLTGLSWKYFGSSGAIARFRSWNSDLLGDARKTGALRKGLRLRVPDAEGPVPPLLEVYDLASDPRETRNLVADEPEFAARTHALLKAHATPSSAPATPLGLQDPEVLEKLRALGYLE